jgi:formate hydrogenlyase transcriptional activator
MDSTMTTNTIQNYDILIVDDEIPNLQLLAGLLEKEGYRVRPAERAQTAIDSALTKPPGLILLDVRMPEMDGFEVCRRIKQDKRTQHVPIIFVSALQDTEARIQGFEAGGVDFISKPFQELEILARVRAHMHLSLMQKNLEQLVDERTSKLSESRASLEQKVRALQESDERYELAVAGSAAGIWDWEIRPDKVYYSDRFKELLGYAPDEFLDTLDEFWNRLHPDDYEAAQLAVDQHLKERVVFNIEYRLQIKSGEYRWFHSRGQARWDKTGQATRMSGSITNIDDRKQTEIELRGAFTEIEQLKNQLEAESAYLQDEIKLEHNFENIIGHSESLKYVLNRVEQVAPMGSPVLIMGETGTGKELMARALHKLSPHGKRTMVKVNCAALPGELIESELFGREKGAFTGATTTQLGRFELAKGSTLFLDEIGELPLELQAKLLRVLESGEFERLGSSRTLRSDARIIAATNRVLEEEVRKGRFREDLWYRLKVFPITVPPLRVRPEDIPMLVKWFVDQLSRKMGKRITEIPKHAIQKLQRYPWPGNVRELKHAVESALITAKGKKLNFELPQIEDTALSDFKSFEEIERDYILRILKAKNWKIGGENSAASTLGMHVNTLRGRMKKLGIKKPKLQ